MRLGDLDALKKEVENLVVGGEKGLKDYYENGSKSDENSWIGGVYDAWELICNAPRNELIKLLDSERPQGEWIKIGEEQGALGIIYKIRKCSKCGWEHSLVIPDNFCPNCGADMKGGAE